MDDHMHLGHAGDPRGAEPRPERPSQALPVVDAGTDAAAGFEIDEGFARFNQRDDVFSRSFWDPEVRSGRSELFYETYRTPLKKWKRVDGYTQKDYAIRNAAWHVTDVFAELKEGENRREGFLDEFSVQRSGPEEQVPVESPADMAREVKHVAHVFGADLVGIAAYDERWVYERKYSRRDDGDKPQELPDGLTSVIVVAQAMDHDLIRTVPSALSGAATGVGYSRDAVVLLSLAQYIINLGYRAVASMNDTALAIPYAIKAGLGEYGRHGLLITKEFGPRVRLGKIFTDLPLTHDRPVRFGVREFCEVCRACTDNCPAKAIPGGPPTTEVHNRSNVRGIRKWTVDGVKCFQFWANQNSDCSICVRVCPFNRDYSRWTSRLWRRLAGTGLRGLMLRIDRRSGRGERDAPSAWWRRGRALLLAVLFSLAGCGSEAPDEHAMHGSMSEYARALVELGSQDQDDRAGLTAAAAEDAQRLAVLRRADSVRSERLVELVESHGWPTVERVGRLAMESFFLLVQHTPLDDLEDQALPRIIEAAGSGDLSQPDVAMFMDRYRVERGLPQRFGTQFEMREGKLHPEPIESLELLPERRRAWGLPPMEAYLEALAKAYEAEVVWPPM